MDRIKKVNWYGLIGLYPLHILLNATDVFRIFITDERYNRHHQVYLENTNVMYWLLCSTIILFPFSILSNWLKVEVKQAIRGYLFSMCVACIFLSFSENLFQLLAWGYFGLLSTMIMRQESALTQK